MSKVLFINHTNDFFGAERILFKVIEASGLPASDIVVVEPSYHKEGAFGAAVKDAGYNVLRLSYKNLGGSLIRSIIVLLYNIPAVLRLCRLVKKEKITCIWSNTSLCCLGIVTALISGVRHVWHIHEPAEKEHNYVPALKVLYKVLFSYKKNTTVFVTHAQQTKWESLYLELRGKSKLIYNPYDIYVRKRVADNICRFGYLGSWSKRKNIPMLIEVFKQVHAQFPSTELLLAQNIGEDTERINKLISQLSEPQSVLVEPVSDGQQFYNRIDVLVLPSYSETWGLVVVEAMQQGIATIVTRQTALQEIAEDNIHTLFINPYDSDSLLAAMIKMCSSEFRNRIGKNAQNKMNETDFNGRFVKQIQELI